MSAELIKHCTCGYTLGPCPDGCVRAGQEVAYEIDDDGMKSNLNKALEPDPIQEGFEAEKVIGYSTGCVAETEAADDAMLEYCTTCGVDTYWDGRGCCLRCGSPVSLPSVAKQQEEDPQAGTFAEGLDQYGQSEFSKEYWPRNLLESRIKNAAREVDRHFASTRYNLAFVERTPEALFSPAFIEKAYKQHHALAYNICRSVEMSGVAGLPSLVEQLVESIDKYHAELLKIATK